MSVSVSLRRREGRLVVLALLMLLLVQLASAAFVTHAMARSAEQAVRDELAQGIHAVRALLSTPLGSPASDASLHQWRQQSGLPLVLLQREPGQAWQVQASALPAAQALVLSRHQHPMGQVFKVKLSGEQWRGLQLPLRAAQPGQAEQSVLLLRSFDASLQPYLWLPYALAAFVALGLVAFVVGSMVTAVGMRLPMQALTEAAHRLGRGEYQSGFAHSTLSHSHEAGRAFDAIREGLREREEQVHRLAFWDSLTGLPNRQQFGEGLQTLLQRQPQACAVLILDLDRFKHVNDALGQALGDKLLCGVAQRLKNLCPRSNQLLARLGGDEFALLLDDTDAAGAQEMARRILRDFEAPMRVDEHRVDVGASIGIAVYPSHGDEASLLMRRAELAMYAAKRQKCGDQLYSPRLDVSSQESLTLLGELRLALEAQELRLYLQPKVNLRSGEVHSAEALLRWEHPQRGLLLPLAFIPFAEQTGFISALTMWIVKASAQAWVMARERGHVLRISVNLSARDLTDPHLPERMLACLQAEQAGPEALSLELTESAIMEEPQRALQTLEALSALGFRIAIDDFGTGYSSLAYLKRLPVDELKIDKSFVMAMEQDLDDAKIVHSTIDLAHNLGLAVVAEGIETERTWQLLASLGCDEGQGFFISRPLPAGQLLNWLNSWRAPPSCCADSDGRLARL